VATNPMNTMTVKLTNGFTKKSTKACSIPNSESAVGMMTNIERILRSIPAFDKKIPRIMI
jgi:hypothetical protein